MSSDDYNKPMTTYEVLEALAPMDVAQMMGQQVHPAFAAGVVDAPTFTKTDHRQHYCQACRAWHRQYHLLDRPLSTEPGHPALVASVQTSRGKSWVEPLPNRVCHCGCIVDGQDYLHQAHLHLPSGPVIVHEWDEPLPTRSLNGPAPGTLTGEYIAAECRRQADREADGYELALVTDRHRRWQALFRAMRRAVEQEELDYDPACVEEGP